MSDTEDTKEHNDIEKPKTPSDTKDDTENQEIDVETDANELKEDKDVTQTAAQELSSAPPASPKAAANAKLDPTQIKTEPKEAPENEPERPNTANSFSSGTSADSIPPLPPLPTAQPVHGGSFNFSSLKRPCVISSMENHARFSASFLANPSPKTDGIPRNKKLLCKANSDSQALYFKNNGLLSPDRDSQLIGVTSEHHLGPQCVIRRKINFESDDAFIKTFQLYWYVDASKGCLESPILSNSNKRIHGSSPIETPYFVITKNQRRHQAYSCTFCKGKTTFISIIQALRHLKANHRHNVRIIIQDPNGVFNIEPIRNTATLTGGAAGAASSFSKSPSLVSTVPLSLDRIPFNFGSLPPRPIAPFTSTSGLTIPGLTSSLIPSIPTSLSTLPMAPSIRPLDLRHTQLSRTTSEIPPDAIEDTTRLTSDNIIYLKDILSRKLERTVIECTPRGGSEVTVIFSDNTQRIVKLANENQCKDTKPKSPPRYDGHRALLRTVSESVANHHQRLTSMANVTDLKRRLEPTLGSDYYQAPSKSKYAAKMEYMNQKNIIDMAKTKLMYQPPKTEGDDGDDNSLIADREVDHLTNGVHNGEKIDSQSHISDSTCTIDIDRDNEDKTKLDEDSPSLHGKSLISEESPSLTICDYTRGIISEQNAFKLKIHKPKLDPKKINISVSEGVVKMDTATQNQYYDSYAKVQVLTTSHRCKICNHFTNSETEMSEHITEHSLKQLMNFN